MRVWLLREIVWFAASVLAVTLVLVLFAVANDAGTAVFDVFTAFAAVVGGIAIYAIGGILRLALWALRAGQWW
jgi:hypothetical protein